MTNLGSLNIKVDVQKGGFFEGDRLVFKSDSNLIKDATFQGKEIQLNPIDYQENGIKLAGFFEKAFGYAEEIMINGEPHWVNAKSLDKFLDRTFNDITTVKSKKEKSETPLNPCQIATKLNASVNRTNKAFCDRIKPHISRVKDEFKGMAKAQLKELNQATKIGSLYIQAEKSKSDYGKICIELLRTKLKKSLILNPDFIDNITKKDKNLPSKMSSKRVSFSEKLTAPINGKVFLRNFKS